MWDSNRTSLPHHGYNFCDDNDDPMDTGGHGTKSAGIIAGNGAMGIRTGVAPNAKIMALKIGPEYKEMHSWSALQFAAEYDAHLISTSIGWSPSNVFQPSKQEWLRATRRLYELGIILVCSAGNDGHCRNSPNVIADEQDCEPARKIPDNIAFPAACPPPLVSPSSDNHQIQQLQSASFACGASAYNNRLVNSTSFGPVHWAGIYPYNPDDIIGKPGLTKPDVCAPGYFVCTPQAMFRKRNIEVLSAYTQGGQTSSAAPQVAGAIALLMSACLKRKPKPTPIKIERIVEAIEQTATPIGKTGCGVKKNGTGTGVLNICAAFNYGRAGNEKDQWWW